MTIRNLRKTVLGLRRLRASGHLHRHQEARRTTPEMVAWDTGLRKSAQVIIPGAEVAARASGFKMQHSLTAVER